MVHFDVSPADARLIGKIAQRASRVAADAGVSYSVLDARMDVTATHANGTPLDLAALYIAKTSDFAHDVFGIRRHLDRTTGKMTACFVPRYATRKRAAA